MIIVRNIINEITCSLLTFSRISFVIDHTFRAAKVYLKTRLAGLSTGEILVGSSDLKNPTAEPNLGIPPNTKIVDEFEGIHLEWTLHSLETKSYPYEKNFVRRY
ncbi:putative AAA-type ATPase domain-containing protein [Arabidopsis thaliana]